MRMDPIIVDRTSLPDRILEPMAPEPLDLFFFILGTAILAMAFFAWIS